MTDKNIKRTNVNELGEFGLIEHLTRDCEIKRSSTIKGVGDDAAVIDIDDKNALLLSTDMMVEGIHFDLMYMPLKHLGYKAVVSNLSDICAMNALPEQITVSIAISNRFSVEALDELYQGIKHACKVYNVDLVGGDTTSSTKGIIISISVLGRARKDKIVYRNGCKSGDIICVTGELGGAYLGLQLLEREKQIFLENANVQPDLEDQTYIVSRQLKPEARTDMIKVFEKAGLVPTSMIDISDGLASELFHLCKQSGVGAYLEEDKIPMNQAAKLRAIEFNLDPLTCAMNGGEDYELLFTIDEKDLEKVRFMPDIYIMGEIIEQKDGINLHTTGQKIYPIKAQGWRHFGNDNE